jgi:hypothetical protein
MQQFSKKCVRTKLTNMFSLFSCHRPPHSNSTVTYRHRGCNYCTHIRVVGRDSDPYADAFKDVCVHHISINHHHPSIHPGTCTCVLTVRTETKDARRAHTHVYFFFLCTSPGSPKAPSTLSCFLLHSFHRSTIG